VVRSRIDEPRSSVGRPLPDEAPLDPEQGPTPQPERHEPKLANPRLRDFTFADFRAIVVRAAKEFLAHNGTLLASALAYSVFFAIPSVLLVAVGLFTLIAGPDTITSLMQHFSTFMPKEATQLLGSSLHQLDRKPSTSFAITTVGVVLAVWAITGAMSAFMAAINLAYGHNDRRKFLKKRLVAVEMAAVIGVAFLLVAALLIFGPQLERYVGDHLGIPGVLSWLWWVAQWPILLIALLAAFAALLYLGPDVDHRRWQFLTPGAIVAAALWLLVSAGFSAYTANFGSYNKTWGSLAAVIVMLTWLWLTSCALLLGAEINAETERSRELRERRTPAST
jgi:membrane protein